MRQKWIVVLIMAGLLAACAMSPVSSKPTEPLNSPVANAPRGGSVIEIERSGGIAGKTELTVVYANGELTVNEATKAQLGASAAQKLVADLDAAGYFALQGSYRSRCNDCYQIRITVVGPTQTKTVSYVEDGQLPDEVTKVVTVLATLKK